MPAKPAHTEHTGIHGNTGIPGIPGTRVTRGVPDMDPFGHKVAKRGPYPVLTDRTWPNQVVLDSPDPGILEEPDPATKETDPATMPDPSPSSTDPATLSGSGGPSLHPGRIRRRRRRIRHGPDPSSFVGRIRPFPHHQLRHPKSLTSQAALGRLDLDPIQRFARTRLGGFWLPGQIDRRYGNVRAAWRPALPPTRTARGRLSPEARSCAAR